MGKHVRLTGKIKQEPDSMRFSGQQRCQFWSSVLQHCELTDRYQCFRGANMALQPEDQNQQK